MGAGAFLYGWMKKKDKEAKRNYEIVGGVLIVAALFLGGYISFATAPSQSQSNTVTTPAGVFHIIISACDDGAGVSSIIVKPDGTQCEIDIAHATYAATAINVTVSIVNQNPTLTTQPYAVSLTYGTIDAVKNATAGTSYPTVALLSDGVTYNIVWAAVSSAPTPTSLGLGQYTASFTSQTSGSEKATATLNTAAFAPMIVGNDYTINLVVAGITLPVVFHASS